jgi:hypothetical protein
MHRNSRIDTVAAERPEPRQNPVLFGSGKPRIADPRRTPRSRPVFGFRPWRYAAATVSAVSGRPCKASGRHRKDARGMSIFALSMAALPCCAKEDMEAGAKPCVSTGRSIHAVPSITPSLREGIEDGPRLRVPRAPRSGQRRHEKPPRRDWSWVGGLKALTGPLPG